MKKRIIIDLIMANACNKRCDYCCIQFNGKLMESHNIDYLLDYLKTNESSYDSCIINFFGWEPLLNYKNIVYTVEKNTNPKISYMLWTNGFLLSEDKLDFFIQNNIKIYLSFHADSVNSYQSLIEKKYLLKHKNIEINFIVSPQNISECYTKLRQVVEFGYTRINIIPIMLTMKWSRESIKDLSQFIEYVDETYIKSQNYPDLIISKYSFFDGIIQEKTFVLDYNLNMYQDSSDELYIWKQFAHLWEELSWEIERITFLWNIKTDTITLVEIIEKHSVKEVFRLIYKLPKKMEYVKDYYLIYKIMNRNKQEEKRWSYMIFGVN